jgi:hypothetical protein
MPRKIGRFLEMMNNKKVFYRETMGFLVVI